MGHKKRIDVTKTYLPPLEEYHDYLDSIWESGWITNHGQHSLQLEAELTKHLEAPYLVAVNNGTIALQIALRALDVEGEVITTPFSYVATTSSIIWEKCKPVFADINPHTLCIDPDKILAKITPATTAILATHVYGIPCEVDKIDEIAREHNLKVIYDCAHAFGVKINGMSLTNFGDLSTLSFHATKLFHSVEGGAIIAHSEQLDHRLRYMRNFGHNGQERFWGLGINGKISELHAAMGLLMLTKIEKLIEERKTLSEQYDRLLPGVCQRPQKPAGLAYNYGYYPVVFASEDVLKRVMHNLEQLNVFCRRYFYPSLTQLPYITAKAPVSEDIASRVLCLPLYNGLEIEDIEMISGTINESV